MKERGSNGTFRVTAAVTQCPSLFVCPELEVSAVVSNSVQHTHRINRAAGLSLLRRRSVW